jgi:hypothetical protein
LPPVPFCHDRLDGILPSLHMANSFPLRGNRLASGELPSCLVLLPLHDLKLAGPVPLIEVVAYLPVSEVAHSAPQGVAHDLPLVRDGLTFKAAILGKGNGFLRPTRESGL